MGTGPSMLTQYDIEEVQAHVRGICKRLYPDVGDDFNFYKTKIEYVSTVLNQERASIVLLCYDL